MPPTFGLIAEGPTDHVVLENILIGFFNDYDISQYIRPLQPLRDATDSSSYKAGGWTRVLEYCKSSVFQEAFEQNDYLIVQIDTDCLHEAPFSLDIRQPVESLVKAVTGKFHGLMEEAFEDTFVTQYWNKILFAVAVDEIECWLIPLYIADNKKASATNNCIQKLNNELGRKNLKAINPFNKDTRRYDELSGPYCKSKTLMAQAPRNPSFSLFLERLRTSFEQ